MARESLFRSDTTSILAQLGVFESDYAGSTGFSSEFWNRLGFSDPKEAKRNWLDYVHPEDRPGVEAAAERAFCGETDHFEEEFRLVAPSGETYWILSKGYVVERNAKGRATRYLGLDVDINTQKALENFYHSAMEEAQHKARESEALRQAGAIIASSLEIHHTVNLILEQAHNVIPDSAAAVCRKQGAHYEVIGTAGIPDGLLPEGHVISFESLGSAWEQMEEREAVYIPDVRAAPYPFLEELGIPRGSLIAMPLIARAHTTGVLAFFDEARDAFSRDAKRLALAFADQVSVALHNAELFEELRLQAATDSLTGTATRRAFFDSGHTMCLLASREGHALSLLMIDFDHFKAINDTYGHQEGDRILQEASKIIADSVRGPDLVGRYGGEEFAVILRGEGLDAAALVAERIRSHLAEISVGADSRPHGPLTASIGIAELQAHHARGIDALLRLADIALYRAKSSGRDAVVVYDPAWGTESPMHSASES
ncbi:MAG: diguanylate cyclase [Spirochaetes bacterium]|nr:diguanylate cyclase [Spirochaetota bacterium]